MNDPNANRPGYKKTEVGWIPKEWTLRSIGELCSFSSGNGFSPKDWDHHGLPIIRIQNLNGNQDFNYFSRPPKPEWIVKPGDLLFAWAGVRGVSFGPTLWPGPTGVLNQHIYKIHPKSDIDVVWLFSILKRVTSQIERRAHGFKSSLLHVHKHEITNEQILVPPFPEQRKIASILSTCDDAIERTRELIAAKREQKKGLMQQLLTGKRRLRGFSTKWSSRRLNDLCDRVLDSADNPSRYPVLSITAGTGFVSQEEKFSRVIAGRHVENYVLLRRGQFSYNKGNSYRYPQGCVYQLREYDEGLVPDVFYSFQIRPKHANDGFIQQYFLAGLHNKQLSNWINTGVRNNGLLNLNASDFFNLRIALPELKEQHAIASVLTAADAEIAALERKLTALREQKRGLMQRLLTGAIRVGVGR